ncbi:MAG: hypothetical protein L6416_03730 [Candidatus Omnitrophica bacterium]|nr:hypothetical protein [Candidatus Omnitrophota bacterium]
MIKLLTIILILFIVCEASAENKLYITSRYKGKIYESCITSEQYERALSWDPMVEESIPLSPEKALQLARVTLEEFVLQQERLNWLLKQVELCHFDEVWPPKAYQKAGKQKWYYVVHFWDKRNPEVALIPTPPTIKEKQDEFNIIVLMNGEACKPMPRETAK